jgi:hypothetical protein
MGIQEKLKELSLLDLSRRAKTDIASLATRHFSTERRGIMGDAPRTTKLINSKIDFDKDWITFNFLTESTEKYGPDYEYKDVVPEEDFRFETNPSKTYEIQLRFYHLSKLVKSLEPKKPKNPPIPTKSDQDQEKPISPVSVSPEIVTPEAPMQKPISSPEKPISDIRDTKITPSISLPTKEPTSVKKPVSTGTPKQALKKAIPPVTIEKPEIEAPTSSLSKEGGDTPQNIPAGNKPPESPSPEEPLEKEEIKNESILSEESISIQNVKDWLWNTDMAIWSNSPSFHWQGFNYNLSQLRAAIEPTDIAPQRWDKVHGNALIDKHLFDLFIHIKFYLNQMAGSLLNKIRNKRESTEVIMKNTFTTPLIYINENLPAPQKITWDTSGEYEDIFSFEVAGSKFIGEIVYDSDFFQQTLMSFNAEKDEFNFSFEEPLDWKKRKFIHDIVSSHKEISISFYNASSENFGYSITGGGHVGDIFSTVCSAITTFLNKNRNKVDIITIEANRDSKSRAIFYLRLVDVFLPLFPEYTKMVVTAKDINYIFIIKKSLYEKFFPEKITEATQTALKTELICTFGTFCPPTREHINLLGKMVKVAEERNSSNIVFIKTDPSFQKNEISSNQKANVLVNLVPNLNVCINEGIETFYDAMLWAYNRSYKDIVVLVGSDQQIEFEAILADYNGKKTDKGFFNFENFNVVSYGKNNPDKSQGSLKGKQAIESDDIEAFVDAVQLPSLKNAKELFAILRYELQANIGLDENVLLSEMGPRALQKIISTDDGLNRLKKVLKSGRTLMLLGQGVDNNGNLISFEKTLAIYNKQWRYNRERVSASLFEDLLRVFYPQETAELPDGFFHKQAMERKLDNSDLA